MHQKKEVFRCPIERNTQIPCNFTDVSVIHMGDDGHELTLV